MYAISLGGDSDTVATMAGAIAGACYGLESIPKSWQKCCEGVEDAKKFAERLYALQEEKSQPFMKDLIETCAKFIVTL